MHLNRAFANATLRSLVQDNPPCPVCSQTVWERLATANLPDPGGPDPSFWQELEIAYTSFDPVSGTAAAPSFLTNNGVIDRDLFLGYRYTIIDAPPILEHPETCLLLEHVDEVLLVVQAGSTYARRANAAVQIVKDAGVKVSGVFLNRFKPNMPFGIGSRSLT